MRNHRCWKTCLLVLLIAKQNQVTSAEVRSSSSDPAVSADEGECETTRQDNNNNNNNDNRKNRRTEQKKYLTASRGRRRQRDRDEKDNKAVETPQTDYQKQVEDSRQGKRNWKRWVRQLLLQEHIEQFLLLDGLLSHLWWKRNGRPNRRKSRANVLAYLENDDRRVFSFALSTGNNNKHNPARNGMGDSASALGMMCHHDEETGLVDTKVFEGMILQVDYNTRGQGFYQNFQEKLELPICRDLESASTVLYAIDTYQLMEPLHLELGITSKHAIDFAYTPALPFWGGSRQQHDSKTALVDERIQSTGPTSGRPSWWKWWFPRGDRNTFWKAPDEEYKMSETAFAGGSHGEVWRGRRLCRDENRHNHDPFQDSYDEDQNLIFKRLKVEHGYRLLEAGLREVYLGKLLAEDPSADGLFTTYVNHFFREVPKRSTTTSPWTEGENDLELWIVFKDAGPSMRSYLYSPASTGEFILYQHSYLWTKLRQNAAAHGKKDDNKKSVSMVFNSYEDEDSTGMLNSGKAKRSNSTINGKNVMKEVLRQVLTSAAFLHDHGIVHRDIKPSNFMCKTNLDLDTLQVKGGGSDEDLQIHCSLGDFSSVYDSYTDTNLYTHGPSREELTIEYSPPETLLGSPWKSFSEQKPQSYDSWSIGVLALELLLGTPNVFSVDQRTTALLTNKMQHKGASEKEIRRALYLAALSQFCIYMPASVGSQRSSLSWPLRQGDPLYKIAMVKESCTLRDFHQALRARDPLGLGFDKSTDQLLHLIWQLLAWDPLERISAAEALQHPYFTSNMTTNSNSEPGEHNAIESQMLDPRMDFNLSDSVDEFICPKCGRIFTDWKSCHQHANARKHAKFCSYDRSKLPSPVNAHSMLPAHKNSGYFDIQGRRPTIEDFHSIHLHPSAQFYGVFDGHTGNLASKYVASTLYEQLTSRLSHLDDIIRNETVGWKDSVQTNVTQVLSDIHQQFLKAVDLSGHGAMDDSGTTVTAVYVTDEAVVIASLGDSRAILSSAPIAKTQRESKAESRRRRQSNTPIEMSVIQLTKDHVASDPSEAAMVKDLGGSVSIVNGLARVNEVLAITRSIGDAPFASVLSRVPHVISMTRQEVQDMCGSEKQTGSSEPVPCFIVLASDGLWDMVSNQEAIDMVAQTVASYESNSTNHPGGAFQEASKLLTLEAYVRGSTDNIGVCVISLN